MTLTNDTDTEPPGPPWPSPEPPGPIGLVEPPGLRRGDRLAILLGLVAFSTLVALAWANSPNSRTGGPALAGDDNRPSVVAGDPSPSMVDAIEAIGGDADAGPGPTADPAGPVIVVDPSSPGPATGEAVLGGTTAGDAAGDDAAVPTSAADSAATDPTTAGSPAPDGSSATTVPTGAAPSYGPTDPVAPTRVFPVNRAQRLSTAGIVELVEGQAITNVADLLSALPPYMGESFVLMDESRSRHRASIDYPRLILYGPDARLLIGVSSHPADPLREVVELAELDETSGLWRFSQLDFRTTFVHDTDASSCAGCHGSPQRPIWGSYPDWPGAFAGDDERLTGPQAHSLMRLKADPIDRFHTIVFPSDHSIQNNGQLYLPSRQYGYANTSFNFELNAAVADGLARRIVNHPSWATDGNRLLAMQWRCDGRYDPAGRDALYNRFGIDGTNDFQLQSPVFDATAAQRDEYDWNQGSTGLDDSVAFRTLDLAAERDPALEAILAAEPLFVTLSNAWFGVLGAERSEFLRVNGLYEVDFRPQNLSGGFVARVCAHLERTGA
ncbi:MAG: hypothetical protein AAGA93_10590 [Actinomycetota bacterium]